jgi:RNAse (barnase) inhibitor barstar
LGKNFNNNVSLFRIIKVTYKVMDFLRSELNDSLWDKLVEKFTFLLALKLDKKEKTFVQHINECAKRFITNLEEKKNKRKIPELTFLLVKSNIEKYIEFNVSIEKASSYRPTRSGSSHRTKRSIGQAGAGAGSGLFSPATRERNDSEEIVVIASNRTNESEERKRAKRS